MDYKLSILIPTLKSRIDLLSQTVYLLHGQMLECNAFGDIELLFDSDNGEVSTGEKRNKLIEKAEGKYIVFLDDDDDISFP